MRNKPEFPKAFEEVLESLDSAVPKKNGSSRRDFLKMSGFLLVSFSMSRFGTSTEALAAVPGGVAQTSGPYLAMSCAPLGLCSMRLRRR